MAAAFFNQIADTNQISAMSAGLEPAPQVHPEVVDAMNEVGIDLSQVKPVALTGRMQSETFFLVTLGCDERCPMIPPGRRADWILADPHGQPPERVREIRDEIRQLVTDLVTAKKWNKETTS